METRQKANREYLDAMRGEIGLPRVEEPEDLQITAELLKRLEVCKRPRDGSWFGLVI
jgi:hypothetical protein